MTIEFQVLGDTPSTTRILSVQTMDAAPKVDSLVFVLKEDVPEFEHYCVVQIAHAIIGQDPWEFRDPGYRQIVMLRPLPPPESAVDAPESEREE